MEVTPVRSQPAMRLTVLAELHIVENLQPRCAQITGEGIFRRAIYFTNKISFLTYYDEVLYHLHCLLIVFLH